MRTLWTWAVLAVFAALSLAVGMSLFSPGHSLFSPEPVYTNDFSLMLFLVETGRAFFSHSRRLWGFDPYFMAGYPLDFIWNSNVFLQVLGVLFPSLPAGWIVKGVYAACFVVPVCTLYGGLRLLGFSTTVAVLGTALGSSYCLNGLPLVHASVGMITGSLVVHLAFFVFCLAVRFTFQGGRLPGVSLAAAFPLAVLVHKTSIVILAIPMLALSLTCLFAGRPAAPCPWFRRRLLALFGIGVVAFVLNGFWIMPMLHLLDHKTFLKGTLFWQSHYLLRPIKDYLWVHQSLGIVASSHKPGLMLLRQSIMVLAIAGAVVSIRGGESKKSFLFLVSCVYLFLLTYYGSFFSLTEQLDPARYDGALNMFLVPLSCKGLCAVGAFLRGRGGGRAVGYGGAAFALFLCAANLLPSFYTDVRACCRLRTDLPAPLLELEAWVKEQTTQEARILVEDSGYFDRHGPGYAYYHTYFPSLLPRRTGRPCIGGPYPYVFLDYHFTDFQDARLLGRDIASYPPAELEEIFTRYNIGWIIVWSREAKEYLGGLSGLVHKEGDIDTFSVYRVDRKRSYFLKGSGTIRAGYNEILLDGLEPEQGEVMLSFHYVETLRTDPVTPIEARALGEDPIGFIVLRSPPRQVRIFMSYSF